MPCPRFSCHSASLSRLTDAPAPTIDSSSVPSGSPASSAFGLPHALPVAGSTPPVA